MGYHSISSITLVSSFKLMLTRVILCCLQPRVLTNKEVSPWKFQTLKCENNCMEIEWQTVRFSYIKGRKSFNSCYLNRKVVWLSNHLLYFETQIIWLKIRIPGCWIGDVRMVECFSYFFQILIKCFKRGRHKAQGIPAEGGQQQGYKALPREGQ